ncbi:fumarylacetoacetate hydrolase family protein [Calorimonas adulescens]|uniref:Fumarylacetoacetate hydrolase family protein n=1 Tax=Calorimonas adulescens TaxID=2606906 RepID=A0A5D8QI51_9THEO|nr:fumarylacetoacetate hydrolase family protein [Calorimonas adulescens]TZE83233.1 fumarylacetoacetate hydrolase family protein [Calorimonas adulescens]
MKIGRFMDTDKIFYGVVEGEIVYPIDGDIYGSYRRDATKKYLKDLKILAPSVITKAVCVGVNYKSHSEELNHKLPSEPLLFIKPTSAVINPEEEIIRPSESSRVDYEGELVVVIGKRAKDVDIGNVDNYILGYTCGNDVTARDLQQRDGQWTRAKSFDTFLPFGPFIETELNPDDLSLRTYLNGKVVQETRTSNLIFKVKELVSFISHCMTLFPGDIIMTGTPSGIGPMEAGDIVEVEIEGIGKLRNHVK